MTLRALALAASLLLAACFVDNGANTPASAATSTGEPGSTGVDDPTTGASTSTATTSIVDATTTTAADASTGTGDAPPGDCWDRGLASWPEVGAPLDLGPGVLDPFITADGLSLYYLTLPSRRPYLSTRAGLHDPFAAGAALAVWDGLAEDFLINYPTVVLGGEAILLSTQAEVYFSLASPQEQDKFTLPQLLPSEVNTEFEERNATATADAKILLVQRGDGPALDPLPYTYTFHQLVRADGDVGYIGDVAVTPINPPYDLALCPALSPDGLRLFYTSTVGDEWNPLDYSTFAIHYTTRAAVDKPWEPVARVPGLRGDDGIVCASSVTADGCQLVYYTFGPEGDEPSHYLADRAEP